MTGGILQSYVFLSPSHVQTNYSSSFSRQRTFANLRKVLTALLNRLPRYPPCDACEKLKDGLTALSYLDTASEAEEAEDVEEVREILGCPGVRALLQVRALSQR